MPFLVRTLFLTLFTFLWWRDVSRERTGEGFHRIKVQDGLKWGMILFIFREVIFFFAWFWSFFHHRLNPVFDLGLRWPPFRLTPLDPFRVPLLNTAILLSSGIRVTWAHHNLFKNHNILFPILITIFLGILFTLFQLFEYINSFFAIRDSVYGTSFFVITGFHGLHVLIGTLFLVAITFRRTNIHFSPTHLVGFEFSIWYWHFVDVVWLFLFSFVYWWGFF